jgi:hypothetical protein
MKDFAALVAMVIIMVVAVTFMASHSAADDDWLFFKQTCTGVDFGPHDKSAQHRCAQIYLHRCYNEVDFSPQDPTCLQARMEMICPRPDFSPNYPWCVDED